MTRIYRLLACGALLVVASLAVTQQRSAPAGATIPRGTPGVMIGSGNMKPATGQHPTPPQGPTISGTSTSGSGPLSNADLSNSVTRRAMQRMRQTMPNPGQTPEFSNAQGADSTIAPQ